jgi:hypothetical protein
MEDLKEFVLRWQDFIISIPILLIWVIEMILPEDDGR